MEDQQELLEDLVKQLRADQPRGRGLVQRHKQAVAREREREIQRAQEEEEEEEEEEERSGAQGEDACPFAAIRARQWDVVLAWIGLRNHSRKSLDALDPQSGRTCLHELACADKADVGRALLSRGPVRVDKGTLLGRDTALHLASQSGSDDFVRLLLSHGADVRARNKLGDEPLHLVSDPLAAGLLLRAGASATARNKAGVTPSQSAAMRHVPHVYDIIQVKVQEHFREHQAEARALNKRRKEAEDTEVERRAREEHEAFRAAIAQKYMGWRAP